MQVNAYIVLGKDDEIIARPAKSLGDIICTLGMTGTLLMDRAAAEQLQTQLRRALDQRGPGNVRHLPIRPRGGPR